MSCDLVRSRWPASVRVCVCESWERMRNCVLRCLTSLPHLTLQASLPCFNVMPCFFADAITHSMNNTISKPFFIPHQYHSTPTQEIESLHGTAKEFAHSWCLGKSEYLYCAWIKCFISLTPSITFCCAQDRPIHSTDDNYNDMILF